MPSSSSPTRYLHVGIRWFIVRARFGEAHFEHYRNRKSNSVSQCWERSHNNLFIIILYAIGKAREEIQVPIADFALVSPCTFVSYFIFSRLFLPTGAASAGRRIAEGESGRDLPRYRSSLGRLVLLSGASIGHINHIANDGALRFLFGHPPRFYFYFFSIVLYYFVLNFDDRASVSLLNRSNGGIGSIGTE